MKFSTAYILLRAGKYGFALHAWDMGLGLELQRAGFGEVRGGRLYATPAGLAAARALPYPKAVKMPAAPPARSANRRLAAVPDDGDATPRVRKVAARPKGKGAHGAN